MDARRPSRSAGIELEAMLPDVRERVDADDPPGLRSGPAAHARHERVPRRESSQLAASRVGHARVLGPRDDRREHAVDVEEQRRGGGIQPELREGIRRHGAYDTTVRLVLIGVVAGFFSALFGVGGGIVIVPLLILLAAFGERRAMATSLAAIGVIALAGAIFYAFHGRLDPGLAALVGLPAALGSVAGTALQQRVPRRGLSLLFAALLVVIAARLLVA